jgi:hypothetical protein
MGVACATPGAPSHHASCPVTPVATADLAPGLRLRARMSFTALDREVHLEAVARATSDELVVVGFAPYGVRLFAVRQHGRELSVEAPSSRELGSVALWVVDALHRIYWIDPPFARGSDAAASWDREGERVTEWREGGRLRREFTRPGVDPASARVSIDYPEAADAGAGPGVEIRNPWCGYEALVVSLEATPADFVPGP